MDTQIIRDFITLTKYKNYSLAAEECYITQSTLSKRIKRLEHQLGVPLFERTTKSVELSEYGEVFKPYAEKMLSLENECLHELHSKLPKKQNTLIIGAIPSLAKYHLTDLITKFILHSKVDVHVITEPSEKLELSLKEGRCDAAFIRDVYDPTQIFNKQQITTDQLMAVVPNSHRYANKAQITIKELQNEHFVLLPEGSRPYNTVIDLCTENNFSPKIVFTDSKISNIIDFVSNGLGISLLMNKNITEVYKETVTVIPLSPAISQSVDLCMVKSQEKSLAQQKLLSFVKKSDFTNRS
ncbi:LysR family transcriptional regulator [Enterococcus casseliflavus]|uniref:LysR family transcriptional regulator n=1 Tax=Enterococcus casseliflavus TaxID=37734 RepID=A0AAW8UNK9_ENTCA|nr:LysR family transcriptional regulator [Enterococcus casseliflavus]MDB1693099.1 LysR family transcriptional regulator [Enterococcus casseliflavus]MDT2963269.1 LysR family transcriptional regulator [Enterococcus casseliflavus]